MCEPPDWLPPLVRLGDHGGDWKRYIEEVHAIFYRDFVKSWPRLAGWSVRCRHHPLYDGKEAGFWHCVQEGPEEEQRTPDLRRCERIAWIRAVLEHADDAHVDVWEHRKKGDQRMYLWLGESYLVVLGRRKGYFRFITAFCTDREHTRRKLRRERDEARNG
jgi:hypothetical protein